MFPNDLYPGSHLQAYRMRNAAEARNPSRPMYAPMYPAGNLHERYPFVYNNPGYMPSDHVLAHHFASRDASRFPPLTPEFAGSSAFEASTHYPEPDYPMSQNGKHVLVTGEAGYIGSHTVLELVNAGYGVTVLDSLVNSDEESLRRVGELSGKPGAVKFFKADICNAEEVEQVFKKSPKFHSCIHFAALKAVGESASKPLLYYQNNINGTLILLEVMEKYECRNIVFSSSATVYGSAPIPYDESSQVGVGITNPYGRTKYMIEEILRDIAAQKDTNWKVVLLRYFNPVGAHDSGRMGEDPSGIPNNLMPYISQVCVGRREFLSVFGNDYDTPDGTGMRDYIHVMDLAKGHVASLQPFDAAESFVKVYNLGGGKATSVLELVHAMEKACGKEIPIKMAPRRAGDLPAFWAATGKAKAELGWEATKSIDDMCADTWRWQTNNPNGYNTK